MVTVAIFKHGPPLEAFMLKARLEAVGIPCLMVGGGSFEESTDVRLMVDDSDAARAMEISSMADAAAALKRPAWYRLTRPERSVDIALTCCLCIWLAAVEFEDWGWMRIAWVHWLGVAAGLVVVTALVVVVVDRVAQVFRRFHRAK